MDLAAGFFALAGVAPGGLLNELRARRERRAEGAAHLYDVRRELYARALRQLEGVAGQVARWVLAGDGADKRRAMVAAFRKDLGTGG